MPLGFDFLTFLASTVAVVPICKSLKVSPVLGFLATGLVLQQLGLIQDREDVESLSELGVLFLLFEMGGQVLITGLVFVAFALPAGSSLGTKFLEAVCGAPPSLVSIRSFDEAVVIAAALSMSSSAFVLQLLSERGETPTRFGSATLGILLFQDIAIVPFLVLLPLIESNGGMEDATPTTVMHMLGPTAINSAVGLGMLLLGGRFVLRRIYEMVAQSRSSETFVALCLLTVVGASLCTAKLGMSDTLGSFIAGVLLSETSFRTQVEADIRPFRGLLLGLFFVSVGSSINMGVLQEDWEVVAWMLAGLVSFKAAVNIALGPLFGLTRGESIRTGFMLAQGGEFAFVLLSLACSLKVLPNQLNQLLIIVVVFSMALTPALAEAGKWIAAETDRRWPEGGAAASGGSPGVSPGDGELADGEPVVILGFGPQGQMVANMLGSPLAGPSKRLSYVAFDLDPARVRAARAAGFAVVYGDGSRENVLHAAGVSRPRAVACCHTVLEMNKAAVELVEVLYPGVPIYACAKDFREAATLKMAGATSVTITGSEAGLNLGTRLLSDFGSSAGDAETLRKGIQKSLEVRTEALQRRLKSEAENGGEGSDADAAGARGEADGSGGRGLQLPGRGLVLPVGGLSLPGRGGNGGGGRAKRDQIELFVLDPSLVMPGAATEERRAAGAVPLMSVTESMCDVTPEALSRLETLSPPPPEAGAAEAAVAVAAAAAAGGEGGGGGGGSSGPGSANGSASG
ncbi:K+ efflux antiporter [Raphidocelis subcapitata]|uniref:K+ efflux antiporter n=1 Tax=Raphidocelis subcapitata TaxID=307507 RepID=A0A2V0NTJ1_9CHLO|nr:K+ efflux antiporter [Raphidocelis subcapitata]|eukprot:GBF88863.1 K+ efflux antiporter [Raphidocelis subcapitata]